MVILIFAAFIVTCFTVNAVAHRIHMNKSKSHVSTEETSEILNDVTTSVTNRHLKCI